MAHYLFRKKIIVGRGVIGAGFLTSRLMPFVLPNQQRQIAERNITEKLFFHFLNFGISDSFYFSKGGRIVITFRVSRRRREMYRGHARLCVCLHVCLSDCLCMHTLGLLHGPECNLKRVLDDAP